MLQTAVKNISKNSILTRNGSNYSNQRFNELLVCFSLLLLLPNSVSRYLAIMPSRASFFSTCLGFFAASASRSVPARCGLSSIM